jgi:N-acetylglutamate synthase-like GNAT family acetyltransferase
MNPSFEIVAFNPGHQIGISILDAAIQVEFADPVFTPGSKPVIELAQNPNAKYWVALVDGKVAGTVGIVILNDGAGAIKRLMLLDEYRGTGISKAFMETVYQYATNKLINTLYLGTMGQFVVAQHFYRKQGFEEIGRTELPEDFKPNPVDSIFFKKKLVGSR